MNFKYTYEFGNKFKKNIKMFGGENFKSLGKTSEAKKILKAIKQFQDIIGNRDIMHADVKSDLWKANGWHQLDDTHGKLNYIGYWDFHVNSIKPDCTIIVDVDKESDDTYIITFVDIGTHKSLGIANTFHSALKTDTGKYTFTEVFSELETLNN